MVAAEAVFAIAEAVDWVTSTVFTAVVATAAVVDVFAIIAVEAIVVANTFAVIRITFAIFTAVNVAALVKSLAVIARVTPVADTLAVRRSAITVVVTVVTAAKIFKLAVETAEAVFTLAFTGAWVTGTVVTAIYVLRATFVFNLTESA